MRDLTMTRTIRSDIYTSRFIRTGNSYAMVVPPYLMEKMGLHLGDLFAMNFQHGVLWVVRLQPHMIVSRETVAKVFDELFPDKEDANAR